MTSSAGKLVLVTGASGLIGGIAARALSQKHRVRALNRRAAGGSAGPDTAPNTSAARSSSSTFHCVIWFGCRSNWLASSARVFSPRTAASATFALNSAEWFRRGRLLISLAPASKGTIMPFSGRDSTYPTVQFSGTTSPSLRASGRTGLEGGVSKAERQLWDEMESDWTAFENERARAVSHLGLGNSEVQIDVQLPSDVPTEQMASVTVRRSQGYFRQIVLAAYQGTCAISGLAVPEMLNASHIIPWSKYEKRQTDPRNGIALNVLYDRGFDRELISIDRRLRVLVSSRLKGVVASDFHRSTLIAIEGSQVFAPKRFGPDPTALEYHRDIVFVN